MKATSNLAILSLLCLPLVLNAATYYVKPDGNDSAAGTSWATALATPNKGFSKVNSSRGSTLIISNGIYQLTGAIGCTGGSSEANRTIVKGASGNPDDVIFDAHGASECLRLASYITVSGITFSNGVNGTSCPAGGVRFANSSGNTDYEIIVSNCVVTCCTNTFPDYRHGAAVDLIGHNLLVDSVVRNNTAVSTNGAGVIMLNRSDLKGPPKMLRCRIEGNSAARCGAGVYISANVNTESGKSGGRTVIEIEDCEIVGNTSGSAGAGVYSPGYFDIRLTGCTISNNTVASANGGGVRFEKGSVTMLNCTVAGNSALIGAGVDVVPTASSPDAAIATLICSNTTFKGNTASTSGGAARIHQYGRAYFDNCTFFGNRTTSGSVSDGNNAYGGGGVFLSDQYEKGWCSISNCVFGGNSTNGRGGAFGHTWNSTCQATIANSVFTNNTSLRQGGAIVVREDKDHKHDTNATTIRNCLVANNRTTLSSADSNGAGVQLVTYNAVIVENCTFVSNVTAYTSSGGVHQRYGGTLKNCIFAFNRKNGGTADESGWTDANGTFLNCCSYPGTTTHLTAANGCINADPKFADVAKGDFSLQPSSPCRNAGANGAWMEWALDLAGNPRLDDTTVDIGCYEWQSIAGFTILFK